MATFPRSLIGQSASALPSGSDVDLLGDGESIIYLDAEISDGALDLRVPQEQLDGPQVAGTPVDQGCLGSTQRMCPEEGRVQANASDPLRHQAGAAVFASSTGEQELARFFASHRQILVNSLAGLLGDLEFHGTAGLLLAHCRALECVAVRCDIVDHQAHDITPAQLAIDREIEESQIPNTKGRKY